MSISMKTASQRRLPLLKLFSIALLCLSSVPVMAAGIDVSKIPPLKEQALLPQAEFEAKTKIEKEDAPYNDPAFAYQLRVPSDWTGNTEKSMVASGTVGKLSNSVLGMLARYTGAPKNLLRSYVVIEAQTLPYEINAADWFAGFVTKNGFAPTAMTEKSASEIESIYVQVDRDQSYVVRTRVVINGPTLFMVRYYIPQENIEDEKALAAQILASFKLDKPLKEGVEKRMTYGFMDQSYFDYPASWVLKEKNILSIERMSATILQERMDDETSVLEGHFKINVISKLLKTTLAQEIENWRKELKLPRYKLGGMIESLNYKYDPSIKSGKSQIYELVPDDKVNMQSYEILVSVMEGEDYYYITSLISPARNHDFTTWTRNKAVARIVNESIRRSNIKYDANDPYFDYMKEPQ